MIKRLVYVKTKENGLREVWAQSKTHQAKSRGVHARFAMGLSVKRARPIGELVNIL